MKTEAIITTTIKAKTISAQRIGPFTDKQLEELKEVLPKPYADYVPDFPSRRKRQ